MMSHEAKLNQHMKTAKTNRRRRYKQSNGFIKRIRKRKKRKISIDALGDIKAPKDGGATENADDSKNKMSIIQASLKVNNNMDIRDFLTKIDAIQNKEQMKEDKKIHPNEDPSNVVWRYPRRHECYHKFLKTQE